ncbi:hypothetical protein F5884DRAFT_804781 [Xylogone sp. PMI_703]|nr:hypothetical protein F5884DRAFT_804781 [Xylogone sp. PMI_703]
MQSYNGSWYFGSEILGLILDLLQTQFLLITAPLVCRCWRDTINNHPTIQQRLFFQPILETKSKPCINPFLTKVFNVNHTARGRYVNDDLYFVLGTRHTEEAVMRKEASWRRMLVQQPPILRVAKVSGYMESDGARYHKFRFKFDDHRGLLLNHLSLAMRDIIFKMRHFEGTLYCQFSSIFTREPRDLSDALNWMKNDVGIMMHYYENGFVRGNIYSWVERRSPEQAIYEADVKLYKEMPQATLHDEEDMFIRHA